MSNNRGSQKLKRRRESEPPTFRFVRRSHCMLVLILRVFLTTPFSVSGESRSTSYMHQEFSTPCIIQYFTTSFTALLLYCFILLIMPRSSERLKHLKWMKNRVDRRIKLAILRDLFDEESRVKMIWMNYSYCSILRQNLDGKISKVSLSF